MRVALRLVRGARAGESIVLEDNQTVVVGRGSDAGFRIPDPSISRKHCQLSNTPRGLLLADLGSSNGTYVNGQQAGPGWRGLRPGDRIVLGQNELLVVGYERQAAAQRSAGGPLGAPAPQPQAQRQVRCAHCTRPISPAELHAGHYRQDTGGRLTCAACLQRFDFDPNLIEGYRIEKKLGQGAFGEVYKAIDGRGRPVALKTLRPQLAENEKDVARFFREAETARKVTHPSVIAIYDAGASRGVHYIAMEYIDGAEVSKLIERYGRLDVGYSLRVVIQLADALQHLYQHSVIHRDIKPENIMVTSTCLAKLVDFGLAKSVDESDSAVELTMAGEGMGTLAYMPPEQLDDAVNADHRSDIYALGATLYHMLSGQRPFNEKTTRSFILKILREMPPPLRQVSPQVPPALEEIVSKAMSKKPEDRYQEPRELHADLSRLFHQLAAEFASRSGEH
ncbi:MAG: FHA domain-containing protein [Planctomycetota bacterium]|nr:MAG: FHA domain-containing protein [Planctomycetota bacterium]